MQELKPVAETPTKKTGLFDTKNRPVHLSILKPGNFTPTPPRASINQSINQSIIHLGCQCNNSSYAVRGKGKSGEERLKNCGRK